MWRVQHCTGNAKPHVRRDSPDRCQPGPNPAKPDRASELAYLDSSRKHFLSIIATAR